MPSILYLDLIKELQACFPNMDNSIHSTLRMLVMRRFAALISEFPEEYSARWAWLHYNSLSNF